MLLTANHERHLRIEEVNLVSDSGSVATFPPHCFWKVQSLDFRFFCFFKTCSDKFIDAWMQLEKTFNIYGVAEVIWQAYLQAFNSTIIRIDFKDTRIYFFDNTLFLMKIFASLLVVHAG